MWYFSFFVRENIDNCLQLAGLIMDHLVQFFSFSESLPESVPVHLAVAFFMQGSDFAEPSVLAFAKFFPIELLKILLQLL